MQRAWGLRNPTQSPDSSSFFNLHSSCRLEGDTEHAQNPIINSGDQTSTATSKLPNADHLLRDTEVAAGQPAPQTWPPDVLCPAFVLSERLSAGSLFYNWEISRKIQISVSACKTGRRTATPSHSNTCRAPAQLPLWAGPMFQLATLSTRP